MRSIFSKQNYKDMDWNKLVAKAKKQKLDPRLYSFKGVEGAGERDRIEVIRELNNIDQQERFNKALQISLILLAVSATALLVNLFLRQKRALLITFYPNTL